MNSFEKFQEPGRGENKGDGRLSNEKIDGYLKEYEEHGLEVDGEYFVIKRKNGTETRFHLWKKIPHVIGKDGDKNIMGEPKKIENYIRVHLGLPEKEIKDEEEDEEDGGAGEEESKEKEVA